MQPYGLKDIIANKEHAAMWLEKHAAILLEKHAARLLER